MMEDPSPSSFNLAKPLAPIPLWETAANAGAAATLASLFISHLPMPTSLPSLTNISLLTVPDPASNSVNHISSYKVILCWPAAEHKATNEQVLQQAQSEFGTAFDTKFSNMRDDQLAMWERRWVTSQWRVSRATMMMRVMTTMRAITMSNIFFVHSHIFVFFAHNRLVLKFDTQWDYMARTVAQKINGNYVRTKTISSTVAATWSSTLISSFFFFLTCTNWIRVTGFWSPPHRVCPCLVKHGFQIYLELWEQLSWA